MIAKLIVAALAAFSGLMVFASFQPTGLWWAAPLGYALLLSIMTAKRAVWIAWIHGLTLYLLLLPWIGEFVGASAWIALAVVQSLYFIPLGLGWGVLWRAAGPTARRRLSVGPVATLILAFPAWFAACEWLRSTWPFGGFGWGRIAWGQIGGPLAGLIRLGGPALVSAAVVAVGAGLWFLAIAAWQRWARWSSMWRPAVLAQVWSAPVITRRAVVATSLSIAAVCAAGLVIILPWTQPTPVGSVRVAGIQGNVPRLGLDFNAQRLAVLKNHARVTEEYAAKVRRGETPRPDLVIWPENAADVNPMLNPVARDIVVAAQKSVAAPILVGTVTPEYNRMVVWDGNGPGEMHDKKYLQPFGEYMPFRDLLRTINPLVDRAGNFQPGQGDGVVRMRTTVVGVATCYEVSFDGAFRSAVHHGAQILTSPTNNATFGFTDMTYQQLAINRMRAIEYNRAVVVAATSGVSAIVLPDGSVDSESRIFTPDVVEATLPLHDTMTPSARIGPWFEWILAAVGMLALVLAACVNRSTRTSSARANRRKVRRIHDKAQR